MNNEDYKPNLTAAIRRDQLITLGDLEVFKTELLNEIRKLLPEPTSHSSKKWLKSKDVRKMLNISPGTLQSLRINGSLPFTKIGGMIYYNVEEVDKMMNSL